MVRSSVSVVERGIVPASRHIGSTGLPGAGYGYRGFNDERGLGAEPCSSQGLIESLGRLINPGDWDAAVSETKYSVCNNYYGAAFSLVSVDCFSTPFPDSDTVCQVFVAYMNLAHDRKIPEYMPGAHPVTGAGSPYWPAYEGAVAVDRVAKVTNIDVKLVDEILYELYWATKTGRITNVRFIAPWSFRLNEKTLTTVPEGADIGKNRSWFDFSIPDVLRWGLILGLVGFGAYVVTGVVTTVHGVSTAVEHT